MQIILNGEHHELPEQPRIIDLIEQLSLVGQRLAIEVNGDIVPRGLHAATALADGDRLEIVVAVGGG